MKKFAVLLCVALLALGLAACAPEEKKPAKHTHTYGNWTVETAATLFTDGKETRACTAEDCDSANKGKEERVITALGKTNAVFDSFVTYASECTKGEKGIVLNKDEENDCGASTYFGETDKNYDWDGKEMTIRFDLDLSKMAENDFTTWVLSFNKKAGNDYVHVGEIRFGIAKTADGFKVNELFGINFDDAKDLADILEGTKTFTSKTVSAEFKFAYNAENNKLTYTMTVGGQTMTNEGTLPEDIVGLRSLWNAYLKGDGVELSNLVKA